MVVGTQSYVSSDLTTEGSADRHCAGGCVGPRVSLVGSENVREETNVRFPTGNHTGCSQKYWTWKPAHEQISFARNVITQTSIIFLSIKMGHIFFNRKLFLYIVVLLAMYNNNNNNNNNTAVLSLKPERWGSPLFQEKSQEEKASEKRHPYHMIIIIIIIIIVLFTVITKSAFRQVHSLIQNEFSIDGDLLFPFLFPVPSRFLWVIL